MFALLSKAAKLHLPIDLLVISLTKLFSQFYCTAVKFGASKNVNQIEIFYRKFLKKLLKISKSTPNCIVYGETGRYELSNMINVRMVNFWCRIQKGSQNKFSFIVYSLMRKIHDDPSNNFSSKWINKLYSIFNRTGFTFYWTTQHSQCLNTLKSEIKTRIYDIANQNWCSDVDSNSAYVN